jgi:hypothetical protein
MARGRISNFAMVRFRPLPTASTPEPGNLQALLAAAEAIATQSGLGVGTQRWARLPELFGLLATVLERHPEQMRATPPEVDAQAAAGYLRGFECAAALRRDTGVWTCQLHCFAADGSQIALTCTIRQFDLVLTGRQAAQFSLGKGSAGLEGLAKLATRADELADKVKSIPLRSIGKRSAFVADVTRIHDQLNVFSQIEHLGRDTHPHLADILFEAPKIGFVEARHCMDLSRFGERRSFSTYDNLRAELTPELNLIRCVTLDHQAGVTDAGFLRAFRSMAAECTATPSVREAGQVRIFYSIEAEKRGWIEQDETLQAFTRALAERHTRVTVFVNGMTAPLQGEPEGFFTDVRRLEEAFIDRLKAAVPGTEVVHLFGRTVAEKVCALRGLDFFLAPAGTASLIPLYLDVPGVMYGAPPLMDSFSSLKHNPRALRLPKTLARSIDDHLGVRQYDWAKSAPHGLSYSIAADDLLPFALRHFDATVPWATERPGKGIESGGEPTGHPGTSPRRLPAQQASMSLLIYGGCHADVFRSILQRYVTAPRLSVEAIINFQIIRRGEPFPYDQLGRFDAVIYTPVANKGQWNTSHVVEACQRLGIRTFCLPWLEWRGTFPTAVKKSQTFLDGWHYPVLYEKAREFPSLDAFVEAACDGDLLAEEARAGLGATTGALRAQEEAHAADIRVSDLVLERYRQTRLFMTPDHPARALYWPLAEGIAKLLELRLDPSFASASWEPQGQSRLPILPSVGRALGLEYTDSGFRQAGFSRGRRFTLRQYLAFYYHSNARCFQWLAKAPTAIKHQPVLSTKLAPEEVSRCSEGEEIIAELLATLPDGHQKIRLCLRDGHPQPPEQIRYIYAPHWQVAQYQA